MEARPYRSFGENVWSNRKTIGLTIVAVLAKPIFLLVLPSHDNNFVAVAATNGKDRTSQAVGTTLAFDDGKVVTIQYSQIYFCNSRGPATNATNSPCAVGVDAAKDPAPDVASNTLNVIVPAFAGFGTLIPSSPSNTIAGLPGSGSVFDPTLGANVFSQCPDNNSDLSCINHPRFLNLVAGPVTGVVPLPIHSHIISGHGTKSAQGGWWKLISWSVKDASIWPDPNTGACSAGTGCLTSEAALQTALQHDQVSGPTLTTIYLFFNVVSSNAK